MHADFIVKGLFYQIDEFKFRKYLDIKRKGAERSKIDLMVVMMNPGSSRPVDNIDNNTKETIAVPDKTQDQIMRVMEHTGFNHARILNLSDLREPKSPVFYEKLITLKNKGIPHSIFDSERKSEFDKLFDHTVPVIIGWGVNIKLRKLAYQALAIINSKNIIGIKKEQKDYAFYHPLPPIY